MSAKLEDKLSLIGGDSWNRWTWRCINGMLLLKLQTTVYSFFKINKNVRLSSSKGVKSRSEKCLEKCSIWDRELQKLYKCRNKDYAKELLNQTGLALLTGEYDSIHLIIVSIRLNTIYSTAFHRTCFIYI